MDTNISKIKLTVKEQLRGNYIKLVAILLLTSIVSLGLNLLSTSLLKDSMEFGAITFLLSLVMIVANYIIQFLFLKIARGQKFNMGDIKFGFSRFFIIFGSALLLSILSAIILFFGAFLLGMVLPLYLAFALLVQLVFFVLQALVAYAIYDGSKGIMTIIKGSYGLIKRQYKAFFACTLIYFLINVVISMGSNMYIASFYEGIKEITNIDSALGYSIGHAYKNFVPLLSIYFGNQLISALLFPFVYLAYANIYEENKDRFFLFDSIIEERVVVDLDKD